MKPRRVDRLNSLLKEVISDVIRKEVKNPHLPNLITITNVEITKDMRQAKVYFSVIGDEKSKAQALNILHSAAGHIGSRAAKQVVIRYFPKLTFFLDESLEQRMHIESLMMDIKDERKDREEEDTEE